ncbi:hypothetical protein GN956_G21927 [Arapaima gigas]
MTPQSLVFSLILASAVTAGVCQLSRPANLTLSSVGFIPLLEWDLGTHFPAGVCYSVMVHILTNATWVTVPECQCVQSQGLCNLTSTFSDFSETYYVKLSAGNRSPDVVYKEAFKPIEDTKLEPPLFSVSECGNDLCVKLQPPSGRLYSVYDKFTYKLFVKLVSNGKFLTTIVKGLENHTIRDLEPGRTYCVTVSIEGRSVHSPSQCVSIPASYTAGTSTLRFPQFLFPFLSGRTKYFLFFFFCSLLAFTICVCSLKYPSVLLLPFNYDVQTCLCVPADQTALPLGQYMFDGDASNSEEESDQNTAASASKSHGGYESRPKQLRHSLDHSGLSIPTVQHNTPDSNTNGSLLFCPAPMTGSCSDMVFSTHGQALLVPLTDIGVVAKSLGKDGQVSDNDLAEGLPHHDGAEEQDSRFTLLLLPQRLQSGAEEENGAEMEEKGSCSDVNLLSVTLGKYKEEAGENECTVNLFTSLDTVFPTLETTGGSTESLSSEAEEETVPEHCGYMKR